jgi:mannose-6-phosphate isomerase-like protein (cupin superfamily)
MPPPVVRSQDAFATFDERWSPRIVLSLNDYHVKLAKLEGEFVWHSHSDTDELFFVIDGQLFLRFRDGSVELGPGDVCVVPRTVEHQPFAPAECRVLLVEPAGTVNTGDNPDRQGTPGTWVEPVVGSSSESG